MGETQKQELQNYPGQLLHRDPHHGLHQCADFTALQVFHIDVAIAFRANLAVRLLPPERGPTFLPIAQTAPPSQLVLDPQTPPRIPPDRLPSRPLRPPLGVYHLRHNPHIARFPTSELCLPGALLDRAGVAHLQDDPELRGAQWVHVELEHIELVPVYGGLGLP